jgi:hypothetical protein
MFEGGFQVVAFGIVCTRCQFFAPKDAGLLQCAKAAVNMLDGRVCQHTHGEGQNGEARLEFDHCDEVNE